MDMFKLQIERTFWKISKIYAEDCRMILLNEISFRSPNPKS